eukprot:COSAG02_NODE_883_length_16194_cov_11.902765_10_plen_42_part_00
MSAGDHVKVRYSCIFYHACIKHSQWKARVPCKTGSKTQDAK